MNKDLKCWISLEYITRDDIIEMVNINNQLIRSALGDIFVQAIFGNNNSCADIWQSENNPDNICIFYGNDNGQFNQTVSVEYILDKLKNRVVQYDMEVRKNDDNY